MKTNHCYRVLALAIVSLFFAACGVTQETRQSLTAYTIAMQQVEAATDGFLVDYASAEELRAQIEASAAADVPNSYPVTFDPQQQTAVTARGVSEDIQQRRIALARISAYNDALIALAEGQPESVVRTNLESFGGGIESVLNTVGITADGGFAAIIPIASQLASMIQEGLNAQQFERAIRLGKPIVEAILLQLEADTVEYYRVSIVVTERQRDPIRREMRSAMQLVSDIAAESSAPTDVAIKNRVRVIENRLMSANTRTDTLQFVPEGLPFNAARPELNEAALDRLENATLAVEAVEAKDSEIVAKQNAYYELLSTYVLTLRQVKLSLSAVQQSLDSPRNFNVQANVLLDAALRLRDAFAEYEAAR